MWVPSRSTRYGSSTSLAIEGFNGISMLFVQALGQTRSALRTTAVILVEMFLVFLIWLSSITIIFWLMLNSIGSLHQWKNKVESCLKLLRGGWSDFRKDYRFLNCFSFSNLLSVKITRKGEARSGHWRVDCSGPWRCYKCPELCRSKTYWRVGFRT